MSHLFYEGHFDLTFLIIDSQPLFSKVLNYFGQTQVLLFFCAAKYYNIICQFVYFWTVLNDLANYLLKLSDAMFAPNKDLLYLKSPPCAADVVISLE